MPQMESRRCRCCRLEKRIPVVVGAPNEFVCSECRPHTGASEDSRLRRAEAHASRYEQVILGLEKQVERLRYSLNRAGLKIEALERERTREEDNVDAVVLEKVRRLHRVNLRTGKCGCGKPKCPTLLALDGVGVRS